MTPRYKLRTLLILLAVLPPLLWIGWGKYQAWKAEQEKLKALREIKDSGALIYDEPLFDEIEPLVPLAIPPPPPSPPNLVPDPPPPKAQAKSGE